MEPYARQERIAELEQSLPPSTGMQRLGALAELAWHLRERDTRRADAMASDALSLLAGIEGRRDAPTLWGRLQLTRAACALLLREPRAAHDIAALALEAFRDANDPAGCADTHLVRSRIAAALDDDAAARAEAISARRAATQAGDPARQTLAEVALAALASHGDPRDLDISSRVAAADCRMHFVRARAFVIEHDLESAVEALATAANDAPLYGMDELALESELAMARMFATLCDLDGAIEIAERVAGEYRARGWRRLFASAAATVSRWLLERGDAAAATELLLEARAAALPGDSELDAICGEAHLAAGRHGDAASFLQEACHRALGRGDAAAGARALALQARAVAVSDMDTAIEIARRSLRMAREAQSRAAEMEALAALGELHARHSSADRTSRSAIAFLRHAAEIADDIGDVPRRVALMRDITRLHEASGDIAAALAAQRAADGGSERAARRNAQDLALAARLRWLRDRTSLERMHAQNSRAAQDRHERELREAYRAIDRIRTVAQEVVEAPDPAAILETVERALRGVADACLVALFVLDATGGRISRYAREVGRAIPVRDIAANDLEAYAARVVREQRELHVEHESAHAPAGSAMRECATLWFGPVTSGSEVLGVFTVQSRRARAFGDHEKAVFRALCGHAAVALGKARLRAALQAQRELRIDLEERLRRLATVDPSTSLATRAHFLAVARERLERARRDGGPFGIIVADIDAFKAINDVHGDSAGDRVLAAVGETLAAQLQADDAAGRIGAEEFALVLPGATIESTVAAAERMRAAVEARPVMYDGMPVVVTLSFGCTAVADTAADLPDKPAAQTVERLLREAHAGLYEAQASGGNRVIAWPAYQALRALRSSAPCAPDRQSFA